MFWALARVSFRAAKIVSCNKIFFFHGLRSKLPQLFYFNDPNFFFKPNFFLLSTLALCMLQRVRLQKMGGLGPLDKE
jgi:hypothetical protein